MNLKILTIGILILLNMNIGQVSAATSYCGGDIVVWEETDLSAVKDATYTRINGIVVNFEDICRQLHVSGQGYLKSLGSYDYANFWVKVYKEGDVIYEDSKTRFSPGYTGNFDFYTPITRGNHTFLVRRYTVMVPSFPAYYDANWTTRYVVENTDDVACPDVTNLRSVSVTDSSVSLDWDDSTCLDFSKYGVYYKRSSETTRTRTQNRTSSNIRVGGLLSGTSYDFKVTVWDTSGNENSGSVITGIRTDDADDIPPEIEENLNQVLDVFGELFPDKNKDDAYDTMTVAKEFYNGPSSSFRWYKERGKLLDLPTGDLANYAIFLAEYSRHLSETTDPKRSDVIDDMKLVLDELEERQIMVYKIETWPWQ